MITTTRKRLRDIRIGEMLVFTDRSWAVLEEVRRYLLRRGVRLWSQRCEEDGMTTSYVRTPALDLLTSELTTACTSPDGRLVVSVPPQEGLKTSLLRELCISLLKHNPQRHLMYVTYHQDVATMQGRAVRAMFRTPPSHTNDDWRIVGRIGGMVSQSVGADLLGYYANAVIVDDPHRGPREAPKTRRGAIDWFSESVMSVRLLPDASVVVVCTRMHRDDLAGHLIAQGWPSLNIPALADGEAPDALQRPVGTWLESVRAERDWKYLRVDVGPEDFATIWQGCP